jgi:hypothetical protein
MKPQWRYLISTLILIPAFSVAAVPVVTAHSVERLGNGNTLICDGGTAPQGTASKVIEVDSLGVLIWAGINSNLLFAHTAQRLPNGNTLISDTNRNQVIEVDSIGNVVWSYSTGLDYPNSAVRLGNGNTLITDRDNGRAIDVSPSGTMVRSLSGLHGPHDASRLANNHTLVCDSDSNQVIEFDSTGARVWTYRTGLRWPRSAERLANGNTLITDSNNNRIIEVTSSGSIVWSYTSLNGPYLARRLTNGNTLIGNGTGRNVLEITPSSTIAWRYPRTIATNVDTLWIPNPSNNCTLSVHIHKPSDAGPSKRYPAVTLIPGGSGNGQGFDTNGLATNVAEEGLVLMHFDPDGRGLSTNHGTYTYEDYCGYLQQDGLRTILSYLAVRNYVDTLNLGLWTQSYGITLGTGMAARYGTPRLKFLIDWEGPADRTETALVNGGHVPHDTADHGFWSEREAGPFARFLYCRYIRGQSDTDHNPRLRDNHHALALIDSATNRIYGGSGISPWTRCNDRSMNPVNTVWELPNHPVWTPNNQDPFVDVRFILYLHEMVGMPPVGVAAAKSPSHLNPDPFRIMVQPNPFPGKTEVSYNLPKFGKMALKAYNLTGQAVARLYEGQVEAGSYATVWNASGLPAGVYFLRLSCNGETVTRKAVLTR